MSSYKVTKNAFLWGMAAIYLLAFSSLYVQIPGLYGDNGILPARLAVGKAAKSFADLLDGHPTLLRLMPMIGLDTETGLDLLCILGILISFAALLFQAARDVFAFTLLWMLYLSIYQVGQTFMWFQWDILLLEAGFLTILVAPLNIQLPKKYRMSIHHEHDSITLWLVKWLLFRLMFASGIVKLTSGCPTWWGLTALSVHFESQCIPTPLAWYWHQFPEWFLKLSCVATYVIEMAIPFLFFAPVRGLKIFAFCAQLMLQILIILTGNYNFFNLLTIVLCIPLLDDQAFGKKGRKRTRSTGLLSNIFEIVTVCYIGYQTWKLFSLQVVTSPSFSIKSEIAFSSKEFDHWLEQIVPWTIVIGCVSLGYEVLLSVLRCFITDSNIVWKVWSAVLCLVFGVLAVAMFCLSLVPFTTGIHRPSQKLLPTDITRMHEKTKEFHIASSYGLFRRMTGVGGRPEVIVEGSNSMQTGWKEYEFLYKPGNLSKKLPIVAPHQPRLDWQMWFAALGNYQHNPWFVTMVYRLLTGQEEVLELIANNPFPDAPPKYIRAKLYHYHYTSSSQTRSPKNWWTRKEKSEYLPTLSKDTSSLLDIIKHYKVEPVKRKPQSLTFVGNSVKWLREKIGQPEGFIFTMSTFTAALVINFLSWIQIF
ncbi:lipase maturation factor 2-like isoform X1 [Mytilus trossulus]|uniref:lipase maturation factor 2-like isoform X1 n=1 Tax=Mytilus trossulus TaxID=6551 RepID=UPI00300653C1